MRLKFTFLTMLFTGAILFAQMDTVNYLIITECRIDNTTRAYLEITNKGDKTVQLRNFKVGSWGGSSLLDYTTGKSSVIDAQWIQSQDSLAPGESFLMASWNEFSPRMYKKGYFKDFVEKYQQNNVLEAANLKIDLKETPVLGNYYDGSDKYTPGYKPFNEQWGPGKNGFFLQYHFPNGDSIVVDQVCGMFILEGGRNPDRTWGEKGYDVAGVRLATGNCYLIRKNNVKVGQLNFNTYRGTNLSNSEWIPISIRGGAWRSAPWTVGNQGNYTLDANTLQSSSIQIDYANKTLTVPWGVTRGDDIMNHFVKKPGIAWDYMVGSVDSLSHAVRTGDSLVIYVCGDELQTATFAIIAKEPTTSDNVLVPVSNQEDGGWRTNIENGIMEWPRIINNGTGVDTITGERFGIPFATRIDSLLERLWKPANAKWEIIYASGIKKPDLSHGDKIKVTAQNGSVKEYYIKVRNYEPSSNAQLSMITWPDIPEIMKDVFGWKGDTIPGFNSGVYNYSVTIPSFLGDDIPALTFRTAEINATVETIRAKGLTGNVEDRTITFTVTAEDDTTIRTYKVTLIKEIDADKVQPYQAEPYMSQHTKNVLWAGNDYMEIYNPGNLPIDLSYYMIVGQTGTDANAGITKTNASKWLSRYEKYIPGRKWSKEDAWTAGNEYKAIEDLTVNKMLAPGDVFTMAEVHNEHSWDPNYSWPSATQVDVHFFNYSSAHFNLPNHWGELIAENKAPFSDWHTNGVYLYKILNDSVREGLKPATDPTDFQLIDVAGGTSTMWNLYKYNPLTTSMGNPFTITRKPWVQKGNLVPGKSFGSAVDSTEWDHYNNDVGSKLGLTQKQHEADLGKHFALPTTSYMSTITSTQYKLSVGYTLEEIKGITTGTNAQAFLDKIKKADEGQVLSIVKFIGDTIKDLSTLLHNNDTLIVTSADKKNITKYGLNVTDLGLNSSALVTSTWYTVNVTTEPDDINMGTATISGISNDTQLVDVVNGRITYPEGSSKIVVDSKDAYLPYKLLNFDNKYIQTPATTDAHIIVTAEDGIRKIKYHLITDSKPTDAFVYSNIFTVNQPNKTISDVPNGITVNTFMNNLIPSPNCSLIVYDKYGNERINGIIAADDQLVVSSLDKLHETKYAISILGISPTIFAYAGLDQLDIQDTIAYLDANYPGIAIGYWTNLDSITNGGYFADKKLETTKFTGKPKKSYRLVWTVKNDMITLSDTVVISFTCPFAIITQQPLSINQCASDSAMFSVKASGTGLSYQWYKDNVEILGANQATFKFGNILFKAGLYKVKITNSCGDKYSSQASLTVFSNPTANAGSNQYINNLTQAALLANKPVGASGYWTNLDSTINGGIFSNKSTENSYFSGQKSKSYRLVWTLTKEGCVGKDTVLITFGCTLPIANAGYDKLNLKDSLVLLDAQKPVANGKWSIISGNSGKYSNDTLYNSSFTGLRDQSYKLLWTVSNSCGSAYDTILVNFCGNRLGKPLAICKNISIKLNANGNANIAATDIDNGSNDGACSNITLNASKTSFDRSNIGVNNVKLTVTDDSLNIGECTAQVTVEDYTNVDNSETNISQIKAIPNPFNHSLTIEYAINEPSLVNISLLSLQGKEVVKVAAGKMDAGTHQKLIGTANIAQGCYILQLRTKGGVTTKLVTKE